MTMPPNVFYQDRGPSLLPAYLVTATRLVDLEPARTFDDPDVLWLAEHLTRSLADRIASALESAGTDGRRNRVVLL